MVLRKKHLVIYETVYMADLDSTSSEDDVRASFRDNASYEEDGDASKCRKFITACRFILGNPSVFRALGQEMQMSVASIEKMMRDARVWLSANSTASGVPSGSRSFSLEDFRG